MKMARTSRNADRAKSGVALVVVLAFVVLVTGLVVAFFSRSLTSRGVSNSSANLTKADLLARSAGDIIVADLKQEIVNGSKTPPNSAAPFYLPTSPENMLPMRSGNPGTAPFTATNPDPVPNLIRRSVRTDPIAAPGVGSRASNVSTLTPSPNGRSITTARWNDHYLIPKADPATDAPDPVKTFTAPDWVIMTRQGPAAFTSWNKLLKDASPDNTTFAIGRYAYAIYDEGGLLDLNVAGYPSTLTPDDIGKKGAMALADLTRIPTQPPPSQTSLPQSKIDQIVGWRNYATAQPGGFFDSGAGGFTFTPASATSWLNNFVLTNTTGFMKVLSVNSSSLTDQAILSRQELIRLRRSLKFDINALQYFTHFSRTVERPSFQPDPGRPKIIYNQAQGGNNAKDLDDSINPGTRRMTDGKLLIKHRFPLDQLKLLDNPTANKTRIKDLFGLTRSSDNKKWVYDHGRADDIIPIGSTDMGTRLGSPDFFETLKAAIHAGSLGVQHGNEQLDFTNSTSTPSTYPHTLGGIDADLNYQVMKIGANIIDQYDADSYPTVITFNQQDVTGTESIPGLYALEAIYSAEKETEKFPHGVLKVQDWTSAIQFVKLLEARLWNPYVNAATDSSKVPKTFRLQATTYGTAPYVSMIHAGGSDAEGLLKKGHPWYVSGITDYTPLGGANYGPGQADNPASKLDGSTIEFTLPATWSDAWPYPFSDPRTLYKPDYPIAGIGITQVTGQVQYNCINEGLRDAFNQQGLKISNLASPYTVFGFPLGRGWEGPVAGNYNPAEPDPNVQTDATGNHRMFFAARSRGGMVKVTLSCDDGQGGWIPYDSTWFFAGRASGGSEEICNSASTTTKGGAIARANSRSDIRFDPRTDRWGPLAMDAHPMIVIAGDDPGSRSFWKAEWREGRSLRFGSSPYMDGQLSNGSDPADPLIPAANKLWTRPPDGGQNPKMTGANGATFADPSAVAVNSSASPYRYVDPDGVQRRGSSAYWQSGSVDGQPMASTDPAATYPFKTDALTLAPTRANRPVMLNRTFRSVAELGQVFRDTPWKNLDFFTVESGDSALLDFFCVRANEDNTGKPQTPLTSDGSPIVAGRINLNTRQAPVLSAMINRVLREESSSTDGAPFTTNTEVDAVAQGIVDYVHGGTSPHKFRNLSELVGYPTSATQYEGFAEKLGTVLPAGADRKTKQRREAVLRALADGGQVSTWNLLIDVIAQAGRYSPAATDLRQFIVEGEKHYWVHVAIDRSTGQVIDQQWEPVYE